MLQFRIIGLEKVIQFLDNASDRKHYADAVDEVIDDAVMWAKIFAPVGRGETAGTLEESIHKEFGTIIADAPWAVFNEYGCYNIEVGTVQNPKPVVSGSGKYAYRPFLRPALLLAIQDFPEKLFSKLSATSKGLLAIRVGSRKRW